MFKVKEMMIIGYEVKTAMNAEIRKVVICKSVDEYLRIKAKIENAGYKMITFDEVIDSEMIQ